LHNESGFHSQHDSQLKVKHKKYMSLKQGKKDRCILQSVIQTSSCTSHCVYCTPLTNKRRTFGWHILESLFIFRHCNCRSTD